MKQAGVIPLPEQVEQSILTRRLFPPGASILVGVSGGVDSIVLLHLLRLLAGKNRWKLTVAHLDHGLRGANSRADARFVQQVAARAHLPCVVEQADVLAIASEQGVSMEMAARAARHGFFTRTARRLKIRHVALAHHADDQLELFFLRLLRGSGGQGLAGMKWSSPSPADPKLLLARPLLALSKSALINYAKAHRIRYREDATNSVLEIQRNRVRHELLPLLRQSYQPALNRVLPRVMDILGAEADFSSQVALSWLAANSDFAWAHAKRVPLPDALNSRPFVELPVAVQRHCLQFQLAKLGLVPEFDLIEELRLKPQHAICPADRPRLFRSSNQVSKPQSDRREGKEVRNGPVPIFRDLGGIVHFVTPQRDSFRSEHLLCPIKGKGGQLDFEGVRITWRIHVNDLSSKLNRVDRLELFDADAVGSLIELRHWQAGDRFWPIGMKNAVKLQDLFTNLKIPRPDRRQLLLAVSSDNTIFWVEGLRISERFKITPQTQRLLRWSWNRP